MMCRQKKKLPSENRGHYITNPHNALLWGKSLKITIDLHQVDPQKMGSIEWPHPKNQPSNPGLPRRFAWVLWKDRHGLVDVGWNERSAFLQLLGIAGEFAKNIYPIYIPYHLLNWWWIGWIGWLKWIGIKIGILNFCSSEYVLWFFRNVMKSLV